MVRENVTICPNCGGKLRYYGRTNRIICYGNGKRRKISIKRMKCGDCGSYHRELPTDIIPYKHYDAEIIRGVVEGFITPETLGYEDYPCEMTMLRWKESQDLHLLL